MSKRKQLSTPPRQQTEPRNRERLCATKPRQQRPDVATRPNVFFEHLNRDIRNHIYSYLAFAPLEGLDDPSCSSGFAFTCVQARTEAKEEVLYQSWVLLQTMKREYAKDAGGELRLPAQLTSKDDLVGLQHLTITLTGDIKLPNYFHPMLRAPPTELTALTIHYTGESSALPASQSQAQLAALQAFHHAHYYLAVPRKLRNSLKRLIVSFDHRPLKETSTLQMTHFELKRAYRDKMKAVMGESKARESSIWPTAIYGLAGLVGVFEMDFGSGNDTTDRPTFDLTDDVIGHFHGMRLSYSTDSTVMHEYTVPSS